MSRIEWTEQTWNPTTGCDRVSPGCDHCYALTMAARLKGMGTAKYQNDGDPTTSGPGFGITTHEDALVAPLRWRQARLVFVNSMSDLFHKGVPEEFIAKVFAVMALTPQHTYQVLTKRHARMRTLLNRPDFVNAVWAEMYVFSRGESLRRFNQQPWPLPNVWLGVSAEDQHWADIRIPALLDTPAAVRWVSAEPLIAPVGVRPGQWVPPVGGGPRVNLIAPWQEPGPSLDWVVVGGESGPGARRCCPEWIRHLVDQCQATGTSVFVKQLGSVWARAHGADGKGGDMAHWPDDLRLREMPASFPAV